MTRLYLIRHAETSGNLSGEFQGSTDCDLSERGVEQLERLSERARQLDYAKLYVSPLTRAQRTAVAVNLHHGAPCETVDALAEINCGLWERRPWVELAERYADEMKLWRETPHLFCSPGGETMEEVYSRVTEALRRIVREHEGQTVAVVSHGCAIRNALVWLRGLPIDRLCEMPWVHNTSITCADFDDEMTPHIVFEDDYAHVNGMVKL